LTLAVVPVGFVADGGAGAEDIEWAAGKARFVYCLWALADPGKLSIRGFLLEADLEREAPVASLLWPRDGLRPS
jgi:hypothetical protein